MRTPGFTARSASAIPDASPPPPIGMTTVSSVGDLVGELEADRPLAGDHDRVLERMHERRAVLARRTRVRASSAVLERAAVELDLGAVVARRVDLRHRRVLRHEDARLRADLARRPGDRLAVVARARRDDAGRALVVARASRCGCTRRGS